VISIQVPENQSSSVKIKGVIPQVLPWLLFRDAGVSGLDVDLLFRRKAPTFRRFATVLQLLRKNTTLLPVRYPGRLAVLSIRPGEFYLGRTRQGTNFADSGTRRGI